MEIEDEDNLDFIDSDGEDNPEVDEEELGEDGVRIVYDKKSGEGAVVEPPAEVEGEGEVTGGGEEIELFQVEEATGDAFLAVKPWIGAVFEPSQHNDPNPDKPDETYKLEYVFGYRADDSRNNVYYNAEGNVVYMTACLGVILNKADNTQTFFGGNEVENCEKQHAKDKLNHTNDITSIGISNDRTLACSGQNGSRPA